MKEVKPNWPLIVFLSIIKFVLPFLLQSSVYELHRDEYLYYQQGQHVALGYLENPPLLSYLGTISSLFGGSEFSIKFWPALFGALTLATTCSIAAAFGGKFFAQLLSGLAIMTGAYLRMHFLFQPNVLDLFFWSVCVYFLVKYINSKKVKFFYGFAVSAALGVWSKYSIAFFIAALALALLFSRHRFMYTKRFFYKACLVALLIISPNVWWQYQHKWPLVHHMQELQQTQLRFLSPLDFIKDQLLYLLPAVFVWITGLVWLYKKREWRFLGIGYLLVIVLLMLGHGKSYYAMGIYSMLLAAGGTSLEQWTVRRRGWRPALTILVIALSIPLVPMLLPVWPPQQLSEFYKRNKIEKTGELKWEDRQNHSLPQDFADMLGWKELSDKAEIFFKNLPDSIKAKTIVYCMNYGQAGALKFYAKDVEFSESVQTFNGSFLLWTPHALAFNNLLFISDRPLETRDRLFEYFKSWKQIDSVTNVYSRQLGNGLFFFENITDSGLVYFNERMKQRKAQFRR